MFDIARIRLMVWRENVSLQRAAATRMFLPHAPHENIMHERLPLLRFDHPLEQCPPAALCALRSPNKLR
jgi:hypothetical protein